LEETMKQICEHRNKKLLGEPDRLANLVRWSNSQPRGARISKELPIGFLMIACANGEEPLVHFHWNQVRFQDFLTKNKLDSFLGTFYGISVAHKKGHTSLRLITATPQPVLWQSTNGEISNRAQLIGTLKVAEDGIYLLDPTENIQDIFPARPVAVIKNVAPVQISTTNPGRLFSLR
jgi:hypothetical protein